MFTEALGWIGGAAFAVCAIPAAWQAYSLKTTGDLNTAYLSLWTAGEVFTLAYTILIHNYPLLLNYVANALCLVVLWFYKVEDI